jgi:choline/ethanolamine kinase
MQICHDKMNKDIYTEREKELIEIFRVWISREEIEFIREAVKPLQKESLIFSHNDLLANNVLIANDTGKYIFIDYEYSTYNYAIFDIANYFNENEIDYDKKEPPYFGINQLPKNLPELKTKFIECYCLA